MKRRNFVKTLASLAAVGSLPQVASAAGAGMTDRSRELQGAVQGPAALSPRAFGAARYALEIDGTDVGFLQSVEGGNAVSEVITDASGKRLGKLSYEPLRVSLAIPPHADVTKLLGEVAGNGAGRRTIGIVGYDMNMKATSFREFLNAVPTEIAIEKLEAASKTPASVLITFQAEQMRAGDKGGVAAKVGAKSKLASQFRFSVSGLDASAIASLELPVWKRDAVVRSAADGRVGSATPGKADLTTFTAAIAASQAQPWLDWFEQFAILRKDGNERTAKLELLAPDAQTVLYTISLAGVGIAALRSPKSDANKEAIAKLEATLYAERITYGS